jgi:hypothetical protein
MTIVSKLVQLSRGGDARHPRRPCAAVLSLGALTGSPPVAFGAGFPALSHRFARPASPRQGSACPFCGAAMGRVESPTPPHGERLPGAVHELTTAQNGRHRRDTRGWMRAARRGTYVGQSVPGWRRLLAIAQVTAYVKMPICKSAPSGRALRVIISASACAAASKRVAAGRRSGNH